LEPDNTNSGSPDSRLSRSSGTPGLAEELERMSAHATRRDHFESPIVARIAQAPSARPFEGAMRALVRKLRADDSCVPRGSIVLRLVCDSDLDVAVKLDLLREFLLVDRRQLGDVVWYRLSSKEVLEKQELPLVSALLQVVRAGGPASIGRLLDWLGDSRRIGRGSIADVAETLLQVLAGQDARAVLEGLGPLRAVGSLEVLCRIARSHPDEGLAFARRSVNEGAFGATAGALAGLAMVESVREEVVELATAVASDARAPYGLRWIVLQILLHLPPVAPEVWAWVEALPELHRRSLSFGLGARVRDGSMEALEVLERWMRHPPSDRWLLDEICIGFGAALDNSLSPRLHEDLQKRLVRNIEEAWHRGAGAASAAEALKLALLGRSDAEYAWLGIDQVASEVAVANRVSRRTLRCAITTAVVQGPAWTARLLERMTEALESEESTDWIGELKEELAQPRRWSKATSEFILARIRTN
jgi:hypothetical protein